MKFARWIVDEDRDIGISLCWGLFAWFKYKDGLITRWFVFNLPATPKHF